MFPTITIPKLHLEYRAWMNELKHKLNITERQLARFIKEVSGLGLESIKMDNHPTLREDMKTFRKIYKELKEEFRKFEAEWI